MDQVFEDRSESGLFPPLLASQLDTDEDCVPPAHEIELASGVRPAEDSPCDEYAFRWFKLQEVFPVRSGDPSLAGWLPISEPSPSWGLAFLLGYEAFRTVADGSWTNSGIHSGANFGTRLGQFSEWTGIGLQVGGTVGVYDWAGTDYRMKNRNVAQVQGFITYGLFRRATADSPWSFGAVQDWMLNSTFSVFGENPTLSQFRAQIGYATSASNEFGIWGACRLIDSTRVVRGFGPVTWRALNQLNFYWHHKWGRGAADTWVSIGVPESGRLSDDGGSLGDYIANARAVVPFNNRVGLYASVGYMHQSGSPGPEASLEEAWNFIVGVSLYPRSNARSATVAGRRWMPLLPVANNGSFLVDASQFY